MRHISFAFLLLLQVPASMAMTEVQRDELMVAAVTNCYQRYTTKPTAEHALDRDMQELKRADLLLRQRLTRVYSVSDSNKIFASGMARASVTKMKPGEWPPDAVNACRGLIQSIIRTLE